MTGRSEETQATINRMEGALFCIPTGGDAEQLTTDLHYLLAEIGRLEELVGVLSEGIYVQAPCTYYHSSEEGRLTQTTVAGNGVVCLKPEE